MKFKTLVLATILGLTTSFTVSAQITFDYKNQNIQLKKVPKKIAVYDLSALDILNALGLEAQLVPAASFAGNLSKYQQDKFNKAGSLFEPDLNVLKTTKPDLIIVGGRSASKAEAVKGIAPTLDLSPDTSQYITNLTERAHVLARAFGKEKIATEKLGKIATLQQQLKKQTEGKTALMLFAVGENFMPHAENDRFGFVYELAGFKPVLDPSEQSDAPRPEAGSPEALKAAEKNVQRITAAVEKNPDYIIVLDRGAVNTQKYTAQDNIQKHPALKNAKALAEKKVIYVNADAWYITGAGLDNTAFMLEELIKGTAN
ncbi:ABC transporter substrate-binding protein [Acinetobacter sp. YH16031]|uniref:ABC transporter substrate-binding protein n=1 Tax=Acinetobacter sp. YH16031 TaxID=2601180 RepID=UPI0015D1FCFB|nr:ABC transporter substrate-binding protein [Acinetobacter sp. YH16031]